MGEHGTGTAALTLRDDEFILAFRARMLLPIAPVGSECAYRPSNHRVTCSERLDVNVRHTHSCARSFVLSRHNELKETICEFAREAGLQAMTEQFAAEITHDRPADDARSGTRRRPTRHADVRIDG